MPSPAGRRLGCRRKPNGSTPPPTSSCKAPSSRASVTTPHRSTAKPDWRKCTARFGNGPPVRTPLTPATRRCLARWANTTASSCAINMFSAADRALPPPIIYDRPTAISFRPTPGGSSPVSAWLATQKNSRPYGPSRIAPPRPLLRPHARVSRRLEIVRRNDRRPAAGSAHRTRRGGRAAGAQRLRQDDDLAHGRRARRSHSRADCRRLDSAYEPDGAFCQAQARVRGPGRRSVSAPDGRRKRDADAATRRLVPKEDQRPAGGTGADEPVSRRRSQSLPERTIGRSATTAQLDASPLLESADSLVGRTVGGARSADSRRPAARPE